MAPRSSSKKLAPNEILGYIVVIAVIAVILAAIVYIYKAQQLSTLPQEESQTQVTPSKPPAPPTPTPTPTALKHGKESYTVSGGGVDEPHPQDITIDPLDPAVGATQTFVLGIKTKYPVTTAYLSVRTDTKTTKIPLSLSSGTTTDGTWTASWTVPETYTYNYLITPVVQTQYNQSSTQITIRQRP